VTNIQTALKNLSQTLLPEQVITDPVQLLAYEMDASLMDRGMPDGVVLPRSVDDVVKLVQWAHQHKIPLIARASGTGLAGAAVAHDGGVVVAFSQLNTILELDETGRRGCGRSQCGQSKPGGAGRRQRSVLSARSIQWSNLFNWRQYWHQRRRAALL